MHFIIISANRISNRIQTIFQAEKQPKLKSITFFCKSALPLWCKVHSQSPAGFCFKCSLSMKVKTQWVLTLHFWGLNSFFPQRVVLHYIRTQIFIIPRQKTRILYGPEYLSSWALKSRKRGADHFLLSHFSLSFKIILRLWSSDTKTGMNVHKYTIWVDSKDVNLSSQSHPMNNIILSSNNLKLPQIVHIFLNIWQRFFELGYQPKISLQSQNLPQG